MADEITMTSDFLDPEVLSPIVSNTYQKAMVMMPLADIDRTLENKPGDTITMPIWTDHGEAKEVKEGTPIPLTTLSQGSKKVKVVKFGLGHQLTDEANLNSVGDAVAHATQDLSDALAQFGDTALLNAALAVKNTLSGVSLDIDGIDAMEAAFDTDDKNPAYTIICSPKTQLAINKAVREYTKGSELGAQLVLSGARPTALGASIYSTKKMADDKVLMIYSSDRDIALAKERADAQASGALNDKELEEMNTGRALKWVIKRQLLLETDRDKQKQIDKIFATQIAAPYVQNASKVLVASIGGGNSKDQPSTK